jgi:tetratricopeptide (TPR) repeat protein
MRQTRRSLAIFIIYNLVRGAASVGIDNSAHVGGLIAGLILGALVPPMIRVSTTAGAAPGGVVVSELPLEHGSTEESRANRLAGTIVIGSIFVLAIALAGVHAKYSGVAGYGQAIRLIQSGHSDQSVAKLQQVVQREPNLLYPQALLGELLLEQQNPSAALPALEQALVLDPGDFELEHNLAIAYLGAGMPANALTLIGRAFDAEKDNPWEPLFIRGMAEGETSQYARAISDLRAADQENPDLPEAKDALARFEAMQFQVAEARAPSGRFPQIEQPSQPPLAIPYSKLVMKSEAWPLIP